MKKRLDETHILDVLTGQAGPEIREAVFARVVEDPEFAQTYDRWVQELENLEPAKQEARALVESIVASTLARIEHEGATEPVSLPVRKNRVTDRGSEGSLFGLRPVWFKAATAVAALVMVILAVDTYERLHETETFAETQRGLFRSEEGPVFHGQVRPRGTTPTDSLRPANKFSVASAIESVPEGAVLALQSGESVDRLRITKSLRLVAVDGPVKLGVSR